MNNRFLDVQAKLPRELAALEPRVRKSVQEKFSRGRFDVFVSRAAAEGAISYRLNAAAAGQYIAALTQLKNDFSLAGELDLALIAANRDIIAGAEASEDAEVAWPLLAAALQQALGSLDGMRRTEGRSLAQDIGTRLGTISGLVAGIRERSPMTVEAAKRRLEDALIRLGVSSIDPGRLAQEVAFIAERSDIAEEMKRLDSHLRQFRGHLDEDRGEAASNLVAGDANAVSDVFLRDLRNRTTIRVSETSDGGGDGWSWEPAISRTGRFVAFTSEATNLIAADANGVADLFLLDRATFGIRRLSVGRWGVEPNGWSTPAGISGDGRFVAFSSQASNLVDGDLNPREDAFVVSPLYSP